MLSRRLSPNLPRPALPHPSWRPPSRWCVRPRHPGHNRPPVVLSNGQCPDRLPGGRVRLPIIGRSWRRLELVHGQMADRRVHRPRGIQERLPLHHDGSAQCQTHINPRRDALKPAVNIPGAAEIGATAQAARNLYRLSRKACCGARGRKAGPRGARRVRGGEFARCYGWRSKRSMPVRSIDHGRAERHQPCFVGRSSARRSSAPTRNP
jgi:hypothetical protein